MTQCTRSPVSGRLRYAHAALVVAWTALPDAPLQGGPWMGTATVWTGQQVITWGGGQVDPRCLGVPAHADGAAYAPHHRHLDTAADQPPEPAHPSPTWRTLPPTPLPAGAAVIATAWIGTELLVWAGRDGAAAFDPQSWTWRALPTAPEPFGLPGSGEAPDDAFQPDAQTRADSVWTGDRWLAWAPVLDADHDAAACQ